MPPIALAAASDTIRPVAVKIRIHQVWASMLKTMSGVKFLHDRSFVWQEQTFRQCYTLKAFVGHVSTSKTKQDHHDRCDDPYDHSADYLSVPWQSFLRFLVLELIPYHLVGALPVRAYLRNQYSMT